ncbi:cytochrome b/b6 domain-containing protein [Phosphitispora sp. TUW77]|uniref:cytochrome b/b6 domain-containing protein n=1 Tax=Phosphitispora sp. TUW77 TaxID=3152361 RepID=UPI003AB7393A
MGNEIYCHTIPARILHWINAANIGLLTTSGMYIRDPELFALFANMDIARKTHFIAMYLIIYGILIRIYYAWVSKDYREIMFRLQDIRKFPALLRYYLFFSKEPPESEKYNVGQKLLYSAWAILVLVQAITGFGLYFPDGLATYVRILGGPVVVRQVHFATTWVFIVTVALHVYLSFLGGWPVIKSMITGYLPEGIHIQPVAEESEATN